MMKKLITLFNLSIFLILGSACSELVDGLNDNPNSPTSAPFANILTGAEVGNIILQSGETARRAGIFCGYYTGIGNQHLGFNTYTVTNSDFDDLWEDGFTSTLKNAKSAEETGLEDELGGISIGITQVVEALALGTLSSLFGDIPFDDAAEYTVENPAFEEQPTVYEKIQALLDEAIENLELNTDRPTSGAEIYFDGDPDAWIEVAYTLKARYYMHTKQYAAAYTAAQSGISGAENSMYGPHDDSGVDSYNLTYQFFAIETRGVDVVTSDLMVSLVNPLDSISPDFTAYRGNDKTNETARYNFYFEVNSTGTQPNTEDDGFAGMAASAPIVTYQENLLILAEAGFRTNGFDTGLSALNEFRSFMNDGGYLTNPDADDLLYEAYEAEDFAEGGMENSDNLSADNALLREILEERYVTLFAQIEGFCDTRRTMTESTVRVPVEPNSGDALPERFIYPQTEIDANTNVPDPTPGLFEKTKINQ